MVLHSSDSNSMCLLNMASFWIYGRCAHGVPLLEALRWRVQCSTGPGGPVSAICRGVRQWEGNCPFGSKKHWLFKNVVPLHRPVPCSCHCGAPPGTLGIRQWRQDWVSWRGGATAMSATWVYGGQSAPFLPFPFRDWCWRKKMSPAASRAVHNSVHHDKERAEKWQHDTLNSGKKSWLLHCFSFHTG